MYSNSVAFTPQIKGATSYTSYVAELSMKCSLGSNYVAD